MSSILYNIPASRVKAYEGCKLIVRSSDPGELLECLSATDPQNLVYLQLLSLVPAGDDLIHDESAIPVDLVMSNPATEFPRLYDYSKLLTKRPVQISIPVVPGFSKAVKLAVSLHFAVKLEVVQPDPALVKEMADVLDYYLHNPTVAQPIEFFHSLLFAFYEGSPVTLWAVQEEDPACFRYITEQGEETISRRFAAVNVQGDIGSFVEQFKSELLAEKRECYHCEFFDHCGGYFKWPNREFSCENIKTLLHTLQETAAELQKDLASFSASRGKEQQ